jgi:GDSL-like Lipase/Acylhydrolase family
VFLMLIGCEGEVLGDYTALEDTIQFFRNTPIVQEMSWCGPANSFNRTSLAAYTGWGAAQALMTLSPPVADCPAPLDTPIACELHLLAPAVALIEFGTNDLATRVDLGDYRRDLDHILHQVMAAGAIPVLSTIPPRQDSPEAPGLAQTYNQVVIELARGHEIPLWNYWRTFVDLDLADGGLMADGIHPNVYNRSDGTVFTAEALRYGFNQRNLQAVQILKRLHEQVIGQ